VKSWTTVKPLFSEFSYGFVLTHELVNRFRGEIVGAPTLPSLKAEGQQGGYDVSIPARGYTVFLQFKTSQCMVQKSAKEWADYGHRYYRFPIRPASYSKQHALLLDLARENTAHLVAYVAPAFHDLANLNHYFLVGEVALHSVWVPVASIGPISDNEEHWLTFDAPLAKARFWSEPRNVKTLEADEIRSLLTEALRDSDSVDFNERFFTELASRMMTVASRHVEINTGALDNAWVSNPQATCSYLARTVFDSELFFVSAEFGS
jgi:hypothetical protein